MLINFPEIKAARTTSFPFLALAPARSPLGSCPAKCHPLPFAVTPLTDDAMLLLRPSPHRHVHAFLCHVIGGTRKAGPKFPHREKLNCPLRLTRVRIHPTSAIASAKRRLNCLAKKHVKVIFLNVASHCFPAFCTITPNSPSNEEALNTR